MSSGGDEGEEEEHIPTISSTRKKTKSIASKREILAERERLQDMMEDGLGIERRSGETERFDEVLM